LVLLDQTAQKIDLFFESLDLLGGSVSTLSGWFVAVVALRVAVSVGIVGTIVAVVVLLRRGAL
jgi:hypothetical protein